MDDKLYRHKKSPRKIQGASTNTSLFLKRDRGFGGKRKTFFPVKKSFSLPPDSLFFFTKKKDYSASGQGVKAGF